MKKFAGNKPLDEILGAALKQGVSVDMRGYVHSGDDHILFHSGPWCASWKVLYNTVNGRFFGTSPRGERFSSDDSKHEAEPWFQDLLSFFYIEKQQGA